MRIRLRLKPQAGARSKLKCTKSRVLLNLGTPQMRVFMSRSVIQASLSTQLRMTKDAAGVARLLRTL